MSGRRSHSTIDHLPERVRLQVDSLLQDRSNTYAGISKWLKSQGYQISKSAVGRYSMRSQVAASRMAETLGRTQAIAAAVEAHPELDYTRAASLVLMDGLLQRVATAEDEFLKMPLDKAGRLITSLSRNATYEKRVRQELKNKAEQALDQLEVELMNAIRQDPELSGELHDILSRARDKLTDEA